MDAGKLACIVIYPSMELCMQDSGKLGTGTMGLACMHCSSESPARHSCTSGVRTADLYYPTSPARPSSQLLDPRDISGLFILRLQYIGKTPMYCYSISKSSPAMQASPYNMLTWLYLSHDMNLYKNLFQMRLITTE